MKTILVAEDNAASRDLLCTVLAAEGYRVVEACDGRQAVQRARETSADLVILDLLMPHLDGFSVLAELREYSHYASVPAIAITASAMSGDREIALARGFSQYISKPFNIASLRTEVARFLAQAVASA